MAIRNYLFSALLFASVPMLAQLVEKAPGTSAKPASKGVKANSTTVIKRLDRNLSDVGITSRALGSWKQSGSRETLTFRVVSFEKRLRGSRNQGVWAQSISDSAFVSDGLEVPVFEISGKPIFINDRTDQESGLIRLTKQGAEMSIDRGSHWTLSERDGERVMFAFENLLVAFSPMDESFQPSKFQTLAWERGAITKFINRGEEWNKPFFHSLVATIAFGKNEFEGILKYPGSGFVVPVRGIKYGKKWIGRSLSEQPFTVTVWHTFSKMLGALELGGSKVTQIELDDKRLMLGTGPIINYSIAGEAVERLETAIEFELEKSHELVILSDAYKSNFGRSLWTKSDEETSFSRQAEQAFYTKGLKAWYWAPLENTDSYSGYSQGAHRSLDPIIYRIKASGGSYGLINSNGTPLEGSASSITGHNSVK